MVRARRRSQGSGPVLRVVVADRPADDAWQRLRTVYRLILRSTPQHDEPRRPTESVAGLGGCQCDCSTKGGDGQA